MTRMLGSAGGPVIRTKSRATGTHVLLGRAEDLGMTPDDGAWVTICEEHGGIVSHETRALAAGWTPVPDQWCPVCQGLDPEPDEAGPSGQEDAP